MYLTRNELLRVGFKKVGENVLISDKCSIYGAERIRIGSNVRIDDFCILSAGSEIQIGSYIHIACYASLIGRGLIELRNYSSVAAKVHILSSCDDFSGAYMVNPTIPKEYLNVTDAPVVLGKHSIIGTGSVVLPGVSIGDGAAIGALSFVKRSIPEYEIWGGNPIRKIKDRDFDILLLEKLLEKCPG